MLMLNYIAAFPSSWRISFPCSLMLMLIFCFSRLAVNARIPCRVTPALNSLALFTQALGVCGRRGGLMVSALVYGASGLGSSPGRGHCVVFLGKTLYSQSAFLHPGV